VALRNGYVVRRCHRAYKIPGRPLGGICPAGPPWSHLPTASARAPAIRWWLFLCLCSCVRVGAVIIISHRIAPKNRANCIRFYLANECVLSPADRPEFEFIVRQSESCKVPLKQCNKWFYTFYKHSKCLTHTHTYLTYLTRAHTYVCALQQQRK